MEFRMCGWEEDVVLLDEFCEVVRVGGGLQGGLVAPYAGVCCMTGRKFRVGIS